jgi:hypothetical protein
MFFTLCTESIEPILHLLYICSSNIYLCNRFSLQSLKELRVFFYKDLEPTLGERFFCRKLICLQASNSSINHCFCYTVSTQIKSSTYLYIASTYMSESILFWPPCLTSLPPRIRSRYRFDRIVLLLTWWIRVAIIAFSLGFSCLNAMASDIDALYSLVVFILEGGVDMIEDMIWVV